MALPKGHIGNFNNLVHAAKAGRLALLECTDAKTGEPVATVCFVNREGDEFEMVPVARMFDGNPYEELVPPMADMLTN